MSFLDLLAPSGRGLRNPSTLTVVGASALAAAMGALIAFDAAYHEFWRDEVHAVLLGSAVPLHRYLFAMRVEGTAFLFQLMMKLFRTMMSPEQSLLLGGGLGYGMLLFGTYRCILSICGRRLPSLLLTALFAGTYVYAYELGVVIRAYGLGAGFALLTNAYLRQALRGHEIRPVVLATVAGSICALTSIFPACLAGGSFVAFAVVSVWRHRGVRFVLPTLGALPCFALAGFLALPFPGRVAEANVDLHRTGAVFLRLALQALSGSLTPQDWWVSASFGDPGTLDRIAMFRHWAVLGVAAGVAYSVALRLLAGWRAYRAILVFDVLAIVIGWVPLLEIIIDHYWGSPRHHAFLGFPVAVLLAGWGAQRSPGGAGWTSAASLAFASAWFVFQFVICARDVALDVERPFSDSKAAAALLPTDAHLVTESFTMQEGYLFWRPGIVMRGGDMAGRALPYTAADVAWTVRVPIAPLVQQECAAAPDRTFFSGERRSVSSLGGCLRLLRPKTPASEQFRTDERFDLWQVGCLCVAAPVRP